MKARLGRILFVASFGAMAITATAENVTPRDNRADGNVLDTTPFSAQAGETNSTVPAVDGHGTGTTNLVTANPPTAYARIRFAENDISGYRRRHVNCDRQLDSCLKDDDPDQ